MRPLFVLAACVALTVACGGGNTPTSPSLPSLPGGSFTTVMLTRGTMSATIDGTRWTATSPLGSASSFGGSQGVASISGLATGATPFTPGLFISISAPLAVGTYTLNGSTFVSFSLMDGLALRWAAEPFRTGASGTLTLTAASATRLTGTFSFTAVATTSGLSPETRTVTNGTFDVTQ